MIEKEILFRILRAIEEGGNDIAYSHWELNGVDPDLKDDLLTEYYEWCEDEE